MQDSGQKFEFETAIAAVDAADNTLVVGEVIDTQNVDSLTFIFSTGIMADGGATWTVTVFDDDAVGMGTENAVADDFLIGTEAAVSWDETADGTARKIGYIGPKRYVRIKVQPADNSSSSPFSCIAMKGITRKGMKTTQVI